MNVSLENLSNLTYYDKYSQVLEDGSRREDWEEGCERNMQMHIRKFPSLENEIRRAYRMVLTRKVMPSMRSMQFAGRAIEKCPTRIYNCCYLPLVNYTAFADLMFLLLGGTGVGYSVQKHHIAKLPEIDRCPGKQRWLIGDSIEGWADAVKALMKYHFGFLEYRPFFDYSDIRLRGSPLKTSGGLAPGPDPLRHALEKIDEVMSKIPNGSKMTSLDAHDVACHIADAVFAGGIRRAAMIAGFSEDDELMLNCKTGPWWEENGQRARANNSMILLRSSLAKGSFVRLWKTAEKSGCGEPGIYLTNDLEEFTNPCGEIALKPYQFCNLCEVNVSDVRDQEDLNERVRAASFIGTLQASYTDFHYISEKWKTTTESEALIGVSMTGIMSGSVLSLDLTEAANVVKEENERVARMIGINCAARCTCVKPAGTTSLILGTSSGIHPWWSTHYIRRITLQDNQPIFKIVKTLMSDLLEVEGGEHVLDHLRSRRDHPLTGKVDDLTDLPLEECDAGESIVDQEKNDVAKSNLLPKKYYLCLPIKAPEGAITRQLPMAEFLDIVKKVALEWVKTGHRSGKNTHNVSCTVTVHENEWDSLIEWLWENREVYNGITAFPHFSMAYKHLPHEDLTEEEWQMMDKLVRYVDLSTVGQDQVENRKMELACMGGVCERY